MKRFLYGIMALALVIAMAEVGWGQTTTTILSEDFSSITTGNSTSTSGSSTAWTGNTNFPTVSTAYKAGGAVRIGSSSAVGSITSQTLDLSVNDGSFNVDFKVKGWTTVEGNIKVTVTGLADQTVTYTAVMSGSFESKSLTFTGGTAGSNVKIETTAKRAFIDDVAVYYVTSSGSTPPTLTADGTNNDVEHNIDITFSDDATWRAAITAVKIGGTALTVSTDYVLTSGNLQLKPSGLNSLLTTAGSKSVTIEATGYNTASVTQQINAGTASKLGMMTQPSAPATNGATLGTQPAVYVQDQYGNTTTSTADVTAAVGAGSWTLGGTPTVSASSGTATFSDLTATSVSFVTGATISFTSSGLTGITSSTFNIPAPPASLPFIEDFEYTTSTLLTSNGWSAHSGSGTNSVTVSDGTITYSGYSSSGVGNEITLTTTGEDVNKTFTAQSSGSIYISFLVNVTSATTTGDYFLNLGPYPIGSTFRARVYAKVDDSNNLYFGITQTGTAVYTTTTYALNTTYLIVVKYTIVDGATNDQAGIYINPTLNAAEPSSGWLLNTDTPTSDPTDIGAVALRQGSSLYAPGLKLDGIRISTSWSDIVGTDNSLPVSLTSFTAKPSGNAVALAWTTESEIENLGFIVQRRQEAGEWKQVASYTTIETLRGHGSTTEAHEYSYTDAAVQPGATYTYLLSDVSYDGVEKKHTDKAVTVMIPEGGAAITGKFALSVPYPNPFNAQFTIPLTLKESMPVQIYLYDMNGKVAKIIENSIKPAGEYRLSVDCRELSSGIYILKTTISNQNSAQKIVLIK